MCNKEILVLPVVCFKCSALNSVSICEEMILHGGVYYCMVCKTPIIQVHSEGLIYIKTGFFTESAYRQVAHDVKIPELADLKIVKNLFRYVENLFQARCYMDMRDSMIQFRLTSGNFTYAFVIDIHEASHYTTMGVKEMLGHHYVEWVKQRKERRKEDVKVQGKG